LRFGYEKLSRALRKIFSLAMPQFLVAYVSFATMLQRYGFFLILPNNLAIIFTTFSLFHFFTFDICILEKPEAEILS
jgi:hypothetical protein